jgi:hypothetical protein
LGAGGEKGGEIDLLNEAISPQIIMMQNRARFFMICIILQKVGSKDLLLLKSILAIEIL